MNPMMPGTVPTNILAPLFTGGPNLNEMPPGALDVRARNYARTVTMLTTANPSLGDQNPNQQIILDLDGWFMWRAFSYLTLTSPDGVTAQVAIRVRYPDGRSLCDDWVLVQDLVGPLGPMQPLPPGGLLTFDMLLLDVTGAGELSTQIVFNGFTRRFSK